MRSASPASPPDAAADVMHRMARAAARGDDHRVGQRILAGYEHEAWYAGALSGFELSADTWAQLAAWAGYDPSEDLLRLATPTLAILGAADPLVPVDLSCRRYDETAARSSRPQRTVVFPGADHRLRVQGERFADGYLSLLTDWCLGPACRS